MYKKKNINCLKTAGHTGKISTLRRWGHNAIIKSEEKFIMITSVY